MNDMYQEILIKKQATGKEKSLKFLVIGITVLMIATGVLLVQPLFVAIGLALCLVDFYFILPQLDLEYEYLYVNGDIDVDKIMSKSKRKKVASFSKEDLEVMAPTGAAVLKDYMNGCKMADYSSGNADAKTWTLVYSSDKSRTGVILEIPDGIAEDMRRFAPRKVFLRSQV